MLTSLRVAYRATALISVTLFCYSILVLSAPLRWFAKKAQLRLRNAVFRLWAKAFTAIIGMRLHLEGTPPCGRFFLVSNHLSYLDIPIIAGCVHAAFVAKADLRAWPMLGRAFAAADTIFIDRGNKRDLLRVGQLIERNLERDLGVLLFPEGTSGKGDALLPFKPSLFEFPARRAQPVHWVTISYSVPGGEAPAQDAVCWWGDAPFMPHILKLFTLPRIDAHVCFGDTPIAGDDRKLLSEHLRSEMEQGFVPVE